MLGVGFYFFSIILIKASHEHSEKNDKGYILSNVNKVKNEKEKKKEEYPTASQKSTLLELNLFRTRVRRISMIKFVKRIIQANEMPTLC